VTKNEIVPAAVVLEAEPSRALTSARRRLAAAPRRVDCRPRIEAIRGNKNDD
jgi:hypothetical protein